MTFYADLHIHSRFSRATSRDCSFEQLALWARRKGITVVGTGDFTHPAWLSEIREKLVPSEPGLFRLRADLEKAVEQQLPPSCRAAQAAGAGGAGAEQASTRFLLQVEISTIYKRGDRTRKVHHLIYVPDLQAADAVVQRLSRIGNLGSDGRPILGLDSRHLLEIALESGEGSFLIPAHIWTPWFSVLGSSSGFDAVDECYGELSPRIFALETGLSSDPPMNWRLSALDRFRLVSNSDAHSPAKLGREACVFDCRLDFFAMRKALETGNGYGGTVEFFPEEGKYHLDGHRKCGVRLSPEETRQRGGLCPECGKPVTVGVMHRVHALADRPEGVRPAGAAPYRNLVPLPEVLAQILGVGPDTGTVKQAYQALIARLGPELHILAHAPLEEIRRAGSVLLAEAIARMRDGRVIRDAGFDGEYGDIRIFQPEELPDDQRGSLLFDVPPTDKEVPERAKGTRSRSAAPPAQAVQPARLREAPPAYASHELFGVLGCLDPEQRTAAEITEGALLIIAGPGTGKTRTLTHRIAHLIADHAAPPEQCLAITFTRRAAEEMRERLLALLPERAPRIPVMTFHALGYAILREHGRRLGLPADVRLATDTERARLLMEALSIPERRAGQLLGAISLLRRKGAEVALAAPPEPGRSAPDPEEAGRRDDVESAMEVYRREVRKRSIVDFDDLIALPADLLEADPDLRARYRERYPWISVDEFQDIDAPQYRLIRQMVPPDGNISVIGDPDQAIYGFRGTDVRFFRRFTEDFPGARTIQLRRNYRSSRTIVRASMQLIAPATRVTDRVLDALLEDRSRIAIHESATDRAEAEFVVRTIEQLVGGSTFFSLDSGRADGTEAEAYSFSDFAVLYRTDAQAAPLCEALVRSGMPFQKRSHAPLSEAPGVRAIVESMRGMPAECPVAERLNQAAVMAREGGHDESTLAAQALRPLAERSGSMEAFMSELCLGVEVDLWDPRADRISLLTLHASKGLEFAVVFITGCEDGVLPLRFGTSGSDDADEERRLFFVGMTRARSRLYLCHARGREWQGKRREMPPSPFLQDIRRELTERSRAEAHRKKPKPSGEQLSLF